MKRTKWYRLASPRSPLIGYIFILPALVFVAGFFIYPWIYNISLGFRETTIATYVAGNSPFTGLNNYTKVLRDPTFWRTARNTAIFTVFSLLFQFSIGFLLALAFNRSFPLDKFLQGLLLIPWFLPLIASASVFKWFFSEQGTVNSLLLTMGLIRRPISWLTSPSIVIWTVTLVNIWLGIPFNFVLLHTGLRGIPSELYEAASVDGASGWQKTIYITIPLLKPVMIVVLMLGTIYTMKHFDIVWITTQGGPGNASHLFSTLSYQLAFRQYQFGFGAAIANVMVLIISILVLIYSSVRVE
ncbi:MAG: carbohydrate ABC transporter permease [bacterium]